MLGNSNYVDITGQMEEIFDTKIQQINFLTEDNVKDKIEEAVVEIEIKPELFDDIYAKIDHTHTSFNHDINVSGALTVNSNDTIFRFVGGTGAANSVIYGLRNDLPYKRGVMLCIGESAESYKSAGFRYVKDAIPYLSLGFWGNDNILTIDTNKKANIAGDLTVNGAITTNNYFNCTGPASARFLTIGDEQIADNKYSIFGEKGNVILRNDITRDRTILYGNGNRTINGNLNISGDLTFGSATKPNALINYIERQSETPFIAIGCNTNRLKVHNDGIVDIQNNLNVSGDLYVNGVKIDGSAATCKQLEYDSVKVSVERIDAMGYLTIGRTTTTTAKTGLVIGDVSSPCAKLTGYVYNNFPQGQLVLGDCVIECNKSGIINIDNTVKIAGDLYVNGVKIDGSGGGGTVEIPDEIDKDLTINGMLTVNDSANFSSVSTESIFPIDSKVNILGTTEINGNLIVSGQINGTTIGNATITHKTDEIQGLGESTLAEIGTFCETNGGIYTGYNEISETDCICQVKQSTTLNARIVGIITSENEFASHGDVLVKIVPGTYHLGDILCPDITGKARIATETELQYMMLHAIPRPKITSLDTKIEGTVACFLV